MNLHRSLPLVLVLVFSLGLSACGGKDISGSGGRQPYTGPPCMDVLTYPQNLTEYAANAGGSRPLVSMAAQQAAAARQKEAFYRSWRLTKPANWIKKTLEQDFQLKPAKGFADGKKPFPADVWQALVANTNKRAFGAQAGPAITLRHTNMRAMPSSMHFYYRPELPGEGYPFDYFQLSSVAPGTPVYICNVSADGLWVLADGPVTVGWMPAQDVAGVDEAFMERWMSRPFAALVRDRVDIGPVIGHIGTLLPLEGAAQPGFGGALSVYYPRRGPSGQAEIAVTALAPGAAVAVPLPLSPDFAARVGNEMMGQAYGWGGIDEKRDCSALTRDMLAPFGIFLPRHSANQAKAGRGIVLTGLNVDEKEAAIVQGGDPFRTLVWMRGHIGLYVGVYQGKAMLFHNMWGIRTRDDAGGCDGRAIVGKAVVTTLRPGIERPDLCNPGSFLDRIEKASVLLE